MDPLKLSTTYSTRRKGIEITKKMNGKYKLKKNYKYERYFGDRGKIYFQPYHNTSPNVSLVSDQVLGT